MQLRAARDLLHALHANRNESDEGEENVRLFEANVYQMDRKLDEEQASVHVQLVRMNTH